MRKYIYLPLFLAAGYLLLFSTCNKYEDLEDLEISGREAEFALPLFTSQFTLQDVLEGFDTTTVISVDPDGLIHLNYKGDVTARTSDDIFEVLSQLDGIPIPIQDTLVALPFEVPNGIDIDYAILKSGEIRWGWQSDHAEDIEVTVTIPNLYDPQGKLFSVTESFSYSPGFPIVFAGPTYDLTGYRIESQRDSVFVRYELYRKQSMKRDTLAVMGLIINDFKASYVQGYLGSDLYEFDRDTIYIDLFENWTRGDVYFADPKIYLRVENSFGFPVRSKANLVDVWTVDGRVLELESTFIDNGINFNYPGLNEVGESKITNFAFDKDNSNIDVILGAGPIAVDYDFDAVPNPDMDTTIHGFITDTSAFVVQMEVELPIYGQSVGFAVQDTIDIDFEAYDEANKVEFKMIAENEIPLDVTLQIYFVDGGGQVLDSLIREDRVVIESAPVDAVGNSTGKTEKISFFPFDKERFDRVRSAKRIYLNGAFSTINDGTQAVKVLATQQVDIRMGMRIGITE